MLRALPAGWRLLPGRLPAALVAALATFAAAARTEQDSLCPLTDDQSNCVRILACIGRDGTWFHGRAFGRGQGRLVGRISDGRRCTGSWVARGAFGLGQAQVSCEGGMEATVIYAYQDEYTGTAIGRGISNRGEMIKAWSGLHVRDYLRDPDDPEAVPRLPCGAHEVPLG